MLVIAKILSALNDQSKYAAINFSYLQKSDKDVKHGQSCVATK